jgi:2'-5' RNA ligase
MRPRQHLRLFAAIVPPTNVAAAMLEAFRAAAVPPPFREVSPEQLRLTVQFIGETRAQDLADVVESVERSASGIGPFALVPQRLVTYPRPPDKSPPRLVAIETDRPPAILELHRRLAGRLARPRRGKVEKERFSPHVTVCRFVGGDPQSLDVPISVPGFDVNSVRLMSSVMTPSSVRYEDIAVIEL